MKQFLLKDLPRKDQPILLDKEDSHYLIHVRRMKPGEEILCRASNRLFLCSLSSLNPPSLKILREIQDTSSHSLPQICLQQCLPKGKKLDLILRQATEVGLSSIQLLQGDHSIVRLDKSQTAKKSVRWNQIIREARQQSNSPIATELLPLTTIARLPNLEPCQTGFFFHQERLQNSSMEDLVKKDWSQVFYVIGPEGGLSEKEIEQLTSKGYYPVHLENTILRTETAALYGAAMIQTLLREKKK